MLVGCIVGCVLVGCGLKVVCFFGCVIGWLVMFGCANDDLVSLCWLKGAFLLFMLWLVVLLWECLDRCLLFVCWLVMFGWFPVRRI